MFILWYAHEHMDESELWDGITWDEAIEEYTCSFENADKYFHLQFQIGGWKKWNGIWYAQVGNGYSSERVIIENKKGKRLHAILTDRVYTNDSYELWNYKYIKSSHFTVAQNPDFYSTTNSVAISSGSDD
jgi:hypothetical protein